MSKAVDIQKLIRNHQEAVKKQDELYRKNLQSRLRPAGAGLDSDDLSKVAGTDIVGKSNPEEDLHK